MTGDSPKRLGGESRRRCPICGRPADPACQPFCSRRCADVDLARWLTEAYRIPATEDEPDDDETPEPDRD